MSRARYYISFTAGVTYLEFWPSNEPKVDLRIEGNEIFKRWKVDKFRISRTKNELVFDTIAGMFFDPAYFGTDLYYKINVLGTDKFLFIDPVTSVSLDTQNNVYEATPDVNDNYRVILQQYEKKWQQRTADTLFGNSSQFYYPFLDIGTFANVDITTFSDAAQTITWQNDGGTIGYARNPLVAGNFIDSIITVIIKGFSGDPLTLKLVDESFNDVSLATGSISGNGKYQLIQTGGAVSVYLEMRVASGMSISGVFSYQIFYPLMETSGGLVHDVLDDIINGASFMNLALTIDSTILWNDALPTNPPAPISTYITANPTNDYVLQGAAIYNYLWIARTDSFTTAKEDLLEYSLKDIMAILRKLRLYWFIDNDNHFRIEHERYFRDFTAQADLTSATYAPDKPEVDQRVYRYERSDSYSQLNYSEQNQEHEDWIAYPVLFPVLQTSKSAKDITFSDLTTDYEYVRDNPTTASSSGLILLRMIVMDTDYLVDIDQSTITTTNYYCNAKLSWAWLFANYYNYFAEAETGTINNAVAKTYTHVKEYLKQGNVRFRMVADLDWKRPFTLIEGIGWVEAAEYSPETGMYKIDVGYNPYTVDVYVVDSEDIGISIVDDDGTTEIIL